MDFYDMKIEREAMYETIANKLEEMILSDSTQISQKLPSENYLADSFGVSRPVIREALKILKERGLISSRQGAPTVITDYAPEPFIRSVNRIVSMKNVSSEQIYQIRNVLEVLAVKIVAENRSKEHLAELMDINGKMVALNENATLSARADLDMMFHKAIAHMSGNPLLYFMMESLAPLLKPLIEKSLQLKTHTDGIIHHDRIISAIADKNAEKACDLMRAHLALSMRNIEAVNKGDKAR